MLDEVTHLCRSGSQVFVLQKFFPSLSAHIFL